MRVVVVGAGIVGAACAYDLARRGADVVVIDRGEPPGGASVRCDGGLLLMNKAGRALPLALRALECWERLQGTLGPVEYSPNPLLMVATAASLRSLERRSVVLKDFGLQVEELDGRACRRTEPGLASKVEGGIRLAENRSVHPMLASAALLRAARECGATLMSGTRVRAVEPGLVITDSRRFAADEVVVSAGSWSADLLAQCDGQVPIEPRRGHVLVLDRAARQHVRVGAMGSEYADVAHSADPALQVVPLVTMTPSGTALVGASRERVGFDEHLDLAVFRALCEGAGRLFPGLAQVPVLRAWVGFRPWTPDGFPVVGRLQEHLWVAAGHEGEGITYGPLTGEVVSRALLDGDPVPPEWSPDRLRTNAAMP